MTLKRPDLNGKPVKRPGGIQSLKYTAISVLLPVGECTSLISKKKTEYYRDKLEHACNKTMFDLVKTLSGKQHKRQQPNFLKTDKCCDMFNEYFKNKTAKLVIDMQRQSGSLRHQFQETPLFTHTLTYFTETTDHDIVDIIRRTDKTCQLDPLPSTIIKPCIQSIAPVITNSTNAVIQQANMPAQLKHAVVRPLLKKVTIDKDALCNYRPVSNLPQLSKVIEKVILQSLTRHIEDESMFDPYQSAYRANHSPETALLFVVNQIMMAFDNRKGTALVIIDFGSAFDTIDHAMLLRRLRLRYGLEGKALDFIASYLQGRTQRVVIGECSHHRHLCSSPVCRRDPYWVHCCSPFTFNPLATVYEPMACSTTNTPMTYSYIVTSLSLNKRLRKPWIILKSVSMSSRIGWVQTCCQWTTARLNTCPLFRSLRLGC